MRRLEGRVRHYAWGSRTALAQLQGRPAPTARPEAELWLGAHPTAPALLGGPAGGVPLTDALAADPAGLLGPACLAGFGPRLPFLLKVLAADQPLSLQAHPDAAQAATGFAAEEAAGVPRDAPHRTYADAWHKPELLVAVSDFEALCGFRDPRRSADLLAALDVPALADVVEALTTGGPATGLRAAVRQLLTMPAEWCARAVPAVVAAAERLSAAHPTYALAGRLAPSYPADAGIVVAMLLNLVRLAPGEGVWMPAGNLHAYVAGVGVEIMAASDNVLRGGLTPKHVNVPELLRVLRFEVLADPVVRPRPLAAGLAAWPVPVADFALIRARADGPPIELPGTGPRVLLCLAGSVRCREAGGPAAGSSLGTLALARGQAAFVPAGAGPVTVAGRGELYQASVG
ncbi:MAG: mannose-6-phosphate isomerase, class I [Dactylosporangium sp.]|nr:mannose-6-phosphate isomerase, class I [Dactylosporangium sp.]NNJ63405.1 mannose-6-phosphate isomerase, class I [Dactylosporangium sp.]